MTSKFTIKEENPGNSPNRCLRTLSPSQPSLPPSDTHTLWFVWRGWRHCPSSPLPLYHYKWCTIPVGPCPFSQNHPCGASHHSFAKNSWRTTGTCISWLPPSSLLQLPLQLPPQWGSMNRMVSIELARPDHHNQQLSCDRAQILSNNKEYHRDQTISMEILRANWWSRWYSRTQIAEETVRLIN